MNMKPVLTSVSLHHTCMLYYIAYRALSLFAVMKRSLRVGDPEGSCDSWRSSRFGVDDEVASHPLRFLQSATPGK